MNTQIGISPEHLQSSASFLNRLLSNEVLLYVKTRNYHWNVEGKNFYQLHQFFEDQYQELDEIMDEVAERVRTLGRYALGTLSHFLKDADLLEGEDSSDEARMLKHLLQAHETIIRTIRTELPRIEDEWKDAGTADFVTALLKQHEKMAWKIRAHVNNGA